MTTTTEMINSMFTNWGQLFTDFVPVLEFFLGIFIALFAMKIIWRGVKQVKKL